MKTDLKKIGGYALLCLGLMFYGQLIAQGNPVPAPKSAAPILIKGGSINPGNGKPAFVGDLLIENGKITAVGQVPQVPQGAQVVDATGKQVYPGLIACNTQLGIEEVEAVRATIDIAEAGEINPNMRTIVAYNADSRVIPTVRSNGVLLAQVVPVGGLISGSSSVVQLDAWTWEDAAYLKDDAIHLFWPEMHYSTHRSAPPADEQKKRIKENLDKISRSLDDARAYRLAKMAGKLEQQDLRWEAMIPVLEKKQSLWIHCTTERQIRAALAFALEEDVKIVLVGVEDAWLCIKEIAAQKVPVVLHPPHSLPRQEQDDVDQPFKTANMLYTAGIQVAITNDGFWQQRNLPFLAGTVASLGLGKAESLQLITKNAADILGIGDRTGTLEVGKDANVLISSGDLLDMRTSDVIWACIQGRIIDLGNHHKALWKKYEARP